MFLKQHDVFLRILTWIQNIKTYQTNTANKIKGSLYAHFLLK